MTRRELIRAASAGIIAHPLIRASKPVVRPNIVLILADDMGYSDLGCYGSEISTPNLDGLAKGGVRFTQFYNTARCCPTRASLITGLYPHQAGVGHMVENRGVPAYQGYLNDRSVTIAEALRAGGYRTLMSGKWHVGEDRPHWPVDRGFDRYFGLISGASSYFALDAGRKMALDGEPYTPGRDFYMTDAITDHAVGFVDRYARENRPFFLYTAYTAPHWPLHALPKDIAKYRGRYRQGWDALRAERHARMISMGLVDRRWPLTPRDSSAPVWDNLTPAEKDAFDLKMAVYAAQVDRMDQGVGRLLSKLRETGADRNTLVLFLADNGGCAEEINRGKPGVPPGEPGSYFSYGLPWANASNTPFRLYKHWVHEGGIATPLIASWPGMIRQPGSITHQTGHIVDIMATCVDVAQTPYPKTYQGHEITPLEGRSLAPVLRTGKRTPHEALFWEHEGNRAVRQGKWKLVSRRPGNWELYDMEADRTETADLFGQHPEQAARMSAAYDAWARRCGVVPFDQLLKRPR